MTFREWYNNLVEKNMYFPINQYLADFHIRKGKIHPEFVSTHLQNCVKVTGAPNKCSRKWKQMHKSSL